MTLFRHMGFVAVTMCCCVGEEPKNSAASSAKGEALPPALETLISEIVKNTSEEKKKEISQAPAAEMMIDHFGAGLALRNGELNRADSKVRKLLIRNGIFARDDFSSIVLLSSVRRIRGEVIDLQGQIKKFRDYWKKLDDIAPLDLECPSCRKELDVGYLGSGFSTVHPERAYFFGSCENKHQYFFYHQHGWKTEIEIKGEQVDAADRE